MTKSYNSFISKNALKYSVPWYEKFQYNGIISKNTIQYVIQETKTKVTKYVSKGDIWRSTLYKRFPKIKKDLKHCIQKEKSKT